MAGVLPTQGPELRVSDVAVGQRDVARTLLPLNTSSEIDLVVQRHFRNCGLSLTTRCKVKRALHMIIYRTLVYAAVHSGAMFATLV